MEFTTDEMQMLCVMHSGTFSKTLDAVRFTAERGIADKSLSAKVFDKMLAMKPGDAVALAFEPEK